MVGAGSLASTSDLLDSVHMYDTFDPVHLSVHGTDHSKMVHVSRVGVTDSGHHLHAQSMEISVRIFGEDLTLVLKRSDDLFADRFHTYVIDNGRLEGTPDFENCHYNGHIQGEDDSSVFLSTCSDGMTGSLKRASGEIVSFAPSREAMKKVGEEDRSHAAFRLADLKNPQPTKCGSDDHTHGHGVMHSVLSDHSGHDHPSQGHGHNIRPAGDLHLESITPSHLSLAKKVEQHVESVLAERSFQASTEAAPTKIKVEEVTSTPLRKEEPISKNPGSPPLHALMIKSLKDKHEEDHGQSPKPQSCSTVGVVPNAVPKNNCNCKSEWTYNGQSYCGGVCGNPDNDANGAWCFTSATCNNVNYAYCEVPASVPTCSTSNSFSTYVPKTQGCACKSSWSYNGQTFCSNQCGNPDNDANGPWCFTEGTCAGTNYVYCEKPAVTTPSCDETSSNGPFRSYTPRGAGCQCKADWSYNNRKICGGICSNPDNDSNGPWCFTEGTCGGTNYAYCNAPANPSPVTPVATPSPTPSPTPANLATGGSSGRNVELLLVLDSSFFQKPQASDSNRETARTTALRIVDGVAAHYRGLNLDIFVKIVGLVIFSGSPSQPASFTSAIAQNDMNAYLSAFTTWRNDYNGMFDLALQPCTGGTGCFDLRSDDAQLMTGSDLSGSTTGLAWVGTMCQTYATGVNEYPNFSNENYAIATVAHEMGHNFGCAHDSSGNSCAASGSIMAAVATYPLVGFIGWSTCSQSYVRTKLQQLEAGNSCLKNDPRLFGDASCGDGIVQGNEQCDLGAGNFAAGSTCTSDCTVRAGAQCASGECCDTSTGRFRPSGTLCRQAADDCDVADFCSGSSATCGTNFIKRDGTACSSAGPGAQCTNGACIGYDAQCKVAWQGYTGTWVHGGRNGKPGSCGSGCGELQCTNTAWDNYCYTYNCPSGYTCTVGGSSVAGGTSKDVCSCLKVQNAVTPVYVADGTPCGDGRYCKQRSCVVRPATSAGATAGCTDVSYCNNRGTCTSTGECACSPGYSGERCEETLSCTYVCDGLNREGCVSSTSCGPCKSGFSSNFLDFDTVENRPCDVQSFNAISVSATTNTDGVNAFDSNIYTSWSADFDNTTWNAAKGGAPPFVTATYSSPFSVNRYDVVSGATDPAMDPRAWVVEGSNNGEGWIVLDERTDVLFESRFERRSFLVKPSDPFVMYRLTVLAIRDNINQGSVTISDGNVTVSTGTTAEINTTFASNNQSYTPQLRVGEIQYFQTTSYSSTLASNSGGSDSTLLIAIVVPLVVVVIAAAVGLWCYKRNRYNKFSSAGSDVSGSLVAAKRLSTITTSPGDKFATSSNKNMARKSVIPNAELPSSFMATRASTVEVPLSQMQQGKGHTRNVSTPPTTLPPSTSGGFDEAEPAPAGWTLYRDDNDVPYYYNDSTGESQWECPRV